MLKYRITRKLIFLCIIFNFTSNQVYGQFNDGLELNDIVPQFDLPICSNQTVLNSDTFDLSNFNGDPDSTEARVIFLNIFTSWCPYCQTEAPFTEQLYQEYQDQGLLVIGAGGDWGFPYDCEGWNNEFNLSYPILDYMVPLISDWTDSPFINFVGVSGVPFNVIIDHTNTVTYLQGGLNESALTDAIDAALNIMNQDLDQDGILEDIDNCPAVFNPDQLDDDTDGIGNECDLCDNLNIFVTGNLDGSIEGEGFPVINVLDLLLLSDFITNSSEVDDCEASSADINSDGNFNLIDIFFLANTILEL